MNATQIAQVATYLNIAPAEVVRCDEWATVLFVVVAGCRPRFVSKKVIAAEIAVVEPIIWTIEAQTRRQEGKFWVARLVGQDEKYTFARQFLPAQNIEWGKRGMSKAQFEIDAPGYYQDCEGDYFRVACGANGFTYEICSYMEVKHNFYNAPVKVAA